MRAGRVPRPGGGGRQARVRTFLRHAETRRAGARARQRAQAAVAGRAGERPQSRGSGRARQADSRHPRPAWRHRAAGRAPHEPGDERLRQGGRAQLRTQDRGGYAGRGAAAPRGGAGLFGEQRLMAALLEVSNLHAAYGPTRVLHGIDFVLEDGSITALLGANGAGKTTTLRALCAMVQPSGEIRFGGARIDGRATEDIVRLGIAHVPDGRGTFVNLSTEENLRLGAYVRKDKRAVEQDFERIYAYFPRLKERRHPRDNRSLTVAAPIGVAAVSIGAATVRERLPGVTPICPLAPQQILGSWSPGSMSTIRVVPKAVFMVTMAGCLPCTVAMRAGRRPSGWGRMGGRDGDEFGFVGDIERVEAEEFASAADDFADGDGGLVEFDADPSQGGDFVDGARQAAARGIAHAADGG